MPVSLREVCAVPVFVRGLAGALQHESGCFQAIYNAIELALKTLCGVC